jgi:hypothetical protein
MRKDRGSLTGPLTHAGVLFSSTLVSSSSKGGMYFNNAPNGPPTQTRLNACRRDLPSFQLLETLLHRGPDRTPVRALTAYPGYRMLQQLSGGESPSPCLFTRGFDWSAHCAPRNALPCTCHSLHDPNMRLGALQR